MAETSKKVLSTYVELELHRAVLREAERKQVSVAAVLRWALIDRYDHRNVLGRQRSAQEPPQ